MAKGNDGNLLQHTVEAEFGLRLHQAVGAFGLHIVLTHGMGPYEAFEPRGKNPSAFKKLEHWLAVAQQDERLDLLPAIARAYRLTQAGSRHYPNSAEILAALLGRSSLSGLICETDRAAYGALQRAWRGSDITVLLGSWRAHLAGLHCPFGLFRPWLFAMDPMTWVDDHFEDDDKLRMSDLDALIPVLRSYWESGRPGAAAIFCYSLRPNRQSNFRAGVQRMLASMPSTTHLDYLETVARGGNKHIGAAFCTDRELLQRVRAAWDAVSAARY